MILRQHPNTFLFLFTVALALAIPPLAIHAAAVSSDPGLTAHADYPEMSTQDCVTLPSRQSSYTVSEFRDRSNYCNSMRAKSGADSNIESTQTTPTPHGIETKVKRSDGTMATTINNGINVKTTISGPSKDSTGTDTANGINNSPSGGVRTGTSSTGTGNVGAGAGAMGR